MQRFRHSGDGWISLASEKNPFTYNGQYRRGKGRYDRSALRAIDKVFDVPDRDPGVVSRRLIEYLDFIEDHLNKGGRITLLSGYRAPEYNTGLRKKGRLAAKASLHQYGMAADVKIDDVAARTLWDFIKVRKFGGAGYYHGKSVHIDVGPARFWDETTSGVGTGISDDNKLIEVITDYDVYLPGETVRLRFVRMTAFPINLQSHMVLEGLDGNGTMRSETIFAPAFSKTIEQNCPQFQTIAEMDGITWRLPQDLAPGEYRIRALFCGQVWPRMPSTILTPVFAVIPNSGS